MRDFAPADLYETGLKERAAIVERAFGSFDPHNLAWQEREQKDLLSNRNYIYGEVIFCSFYPLLRLVKPKQGEVFYDLGCGTGLPSAIASIMFPELAASEGAEFLESIVISGQNAIRTI